MIRAVKGTRDILPPASELWNEVEAKARQVFRAYNYQEIRTPILEETSLFARGVGEDTDIVSKEMYSFIDKDGTSLTLRPECTASVMRAYLEHHLDQRPGVLKLYYIGPMFRRERPQKGRYRQFYQMGAEAIGSESPVLDAEVIDLSVTILRECGLEGFRLLLNSVGCRQCRPAYVARLKEALRSVAPRLCPDCQRRAETNPLRVLDCKVESDQPLIEKLPSILDNLCEDCKRHLEAVEKYLREADVEYELRPRLVRGLDYYSRTTYEIVHGSLGAQNSVLGGGRYDGLAEMLGARRPVPGIGFSIGLDRLILTLEETGKTGSQAGPEIFVIPVGEESIAAAWNVTRKLRQRGLRTELAAEAKLRRGLELADKVGARYAAILGEEEQAQGVVQLKDMRSGQQCRVPVEELISHLQDSSKHL